MINKDLKKRIIEISYKHKLSHLGSVLTAVDIIEEIYQQKKPDEKFCLSSGHAGLGLYVVIEKHEGVDAEKIFEHHGVHPDRCKECHLDCSTGSLGMGLPISVGMALAIPDGYKNVYCLISDGECAEGSIWEALRIIHEQKIKNLKVYVNWNGWAAYKKTDLSLTAFVLLNPFIFRSTKPELPFLKDQDAHYKVMNEEEYKKALKILR